MPTAQQQVEQFYRLFADKQFANLAPLLSDDVWYMQLNSMAARNTPRNRKDAVAALTNWGRWFPDFDILGPVIAPLSKDEVKQAGGAVAGFRAEYSLAGIYTVAIPNLRDRPMRVGQHVSIYVTDRLWLNGAQAPQISRLASSFIIF